MERGLTRQHRATWFRRHRSCSGFQDKPAEKNWKIVKKNGDESNLGVWGVLSSCTVVRLRQISPEKEDCWINKTIEVWKQSSFVNDKKYCMSCTILIWWLAHPPVWDQWALSLNRIGLAFRLFHETTSLAWSTTPPARFYLETFSLPSSHKLCILKLSSGSDFDDGVLMILIIDWRGWLVSWNVLGQTRKLLKVSPRLPVPMLRLNIWPILSHVTDTQHKTTTLIHPN